jgi:hypothetical protein
MKRPEWPGIATAVGVVLIIAIVAWLGVAGPIWRAYWTASAEQWLGFAGNVFGGLITLTAAIIAWFAVRAQIEEQRLASERHRRDTVELRLTEYHALIFILHNEYSQVLSGADDE